MRGIRLRGARITPNWIFPLLFLVVVEKVFFRCRNDTLVRVNMSGVLMDIKFVKEKRWLLFYDEISVFARNPGAELVS